jgi:hypothetical protein
MHLLTMTEKSAGSHSKEYHQHTMGRHEAGLTDLQEAITATGRWTVVMREGNACEGMATHPMVERFERYLEEHEIRPQNRPKPDLIIVPADQALNQTKGLIVDLTYAADKWLIIGDHFRFGRHRDRKRRWGRWDNTGRMVNDPTDYRQLRRERDFKRTLPTKDHEGEQEVGSEGTMDESTEGEELELKPNVFKPEHPPLPGAEPNRDLGNKWTETNTRQGMAQGATWWKVGGKHKTYSACPAYYPRARYVNKYWDLATDIGMEGQGHKDILVIAVGALGTVPQDTMHDLKTLLLRQNQPPEQVQQGEGEEEENHEGANDLPRHMTTKRAATQLARRAHETVLNVYKTRAKLNEHY